MQDIIKQWLILSLLPMCTTDAGLSIISTPVHLMVWRQVTKLGPVNIFSYGNVYLHRKKLLTIRP